MTSCSQSRHYPSLLLLLCPILLLLLDARAASAEPQQLFPDSALSDDVSGLFSDDVISGGRFFTIINSTQVWRIAAFGGLVAIAAGGLVLLVLIVRAAFNKFSSSSAAYSLDRNNYYDNHSYYEYKRYKQSCLILQQVKGKDVHIQPR
jgi:hypothetical protein